MQVAYGMLLVLHTLHEGCNTSTTLEAQLKRCQPT